MVISKKKTNAVKVTAELNQHLDFPVSVITVRRHLHITEHLHQSSNFQVTGLTDAERPFFTKRSGPDRLRAIKRSIGVLVRSVMADGSSETALLAVVSKSIGASCIRREAAG